MLTRPIVRYRVVDRADVLPDQHIVFRPPVRVEVLGLELMLEKKLEHLIAFLRRQLVDANGIARIGIKHAIAGERMAQKYRMGYGRLRLALRVGERRPLAALLLAHHFPE